MAHPTAHQVHEMIPNALLMSVATIVALFALWLLLKPTVEGHRHR